MNKIHFSAPYLFHKERFLYMFNRKQKYYILQKMIDKDVDMPDLEEFQDFEKGYIQGSMKAVIKQITDSRKED